MNEMSPEKGPLKKTKFHLNQPSIFREYVGCGPLPVTVTTRMMTFLVGDPNQNLHFPLLLGGGHTQGMC